MIGLGHRSILDRQRNLKATGTRLSLASRLHFHHSRLSQPPPFGRRVVQQADAAHETDPDLEELEVGQ